MIVTVFGANGPTGLWVTRLALQAGHQVRAVTRRADPLPLPTNAQWTQVQADAVTGEGVQAAVQGADAVLSVLGVAYSRQKITVYSAGTRHIVEAMRRGARGRRLVVVSSGLTYPPPHLNWFANTLIFPFLRNVLGRTLYADMRRMEEDLRTCTDIDWTVMRPGRLYDAPTVSAYRLDPDAPTQNDTARADLAAAMVAELVQAHLHQAVAPTTNRHAPRAGAT